MAILDDRMNRIPPNPSLPGAMGGQKLDWSKLGPLLGAVAAYAFGGGKKGYGGLAAGEFAGAYTAARQRAEEQKRYENELKRQQWIDEMTRTEWEQQQDALKKQQQLADWLTGQLGPIAAGTPGTPGTPEMPASQPISPRNQAEFGIEPRAAVEGTPATPGTPGDPTAKMWSDLVQQSGGAPWAIQGALQYYQASKMPKGARRQPELFTAFSKNNKSAAYALANYDSLSNEELDEWYKDAIAEEADLRGESMEWYKLSREKENGEGGTGDWDPTKIYRGTPFVQQWNQKYQQYRQKTLEEGGAPLSLEKWIRGQKSGNDLWSRYVAESGLYGDPFYRTAAGRRVTKFGGVQAAIIDAIKTGAPESEIKDLVNRYNENLKRRDPNAKPSTVAEWRMYVKSQG